MGFATHEAWWRAQHRDGLRLVEWRTLQGWSQQTLAEHAGLALSTVHDLETGARHFPLDRNEHGAVTAAASSRSRPAISGGGLFAFYVRLSRR